MARWNMLLIVALVVLSVIAFDPQARAQALDVWDGLQLVLADIKEGLAVIIHEITNNTSDVPSEDTLPPDDSPIFNANLNVFG